MTNVIPFPRAHLAAIRQAEQRLIEVCANGGTKADRAALAEYQLSLAIAHADPRKDAQLIWDETLIRVGEQRGEITSDTARELFRAAIVRYYERMRSRAAR